MVLSIVAEPRSGAAGAGFQFLVFGWAVCLSSCPGGDECQDGKD